MGSMPGWFAKPAEFWLFDEYFGPGLELTTRLTEMRDQLADPEGFDDSHWAAFWAAAADTGLGTDSRDHFVNHWLGADTATDFFPYVKKDTEAGEQTGHNLLKMLQQGMHQAATAALEDHDSPKPLSLVWNCAPSTAAFFGIGVANGPHTVVITITTPPFVPGRDGPITPRPDQGWSWRINPNGEIEDSTETINLNDSLASNQTVADHYSPPNSSPSD